MKRKITILLTIGLIAVIALSSCSANGDINTVTANDNKSNNFNESSETITENLYPELPGVQFGGYEIKFLVRNESHIIFVAKDIYAEAENGESINDAVYRRNRKIEEIYDINISQEAVANPGDFIKKPIMSGDCPYDVMIEATVNSVSLSAENMLVDLKTVPYFDFGMPWWDQSLTKELSIGGKLYCNVSDLIISDKNGTWCVLFNKNIIRDYMFDDPYILVGESKWTIDKFFDMSKNILVDADGDGKYNINYDKFGFATEPYNIFVMTVGAGCRLVDKDEKDLPVLSANNERFIAAYEKAVIIHNDTSTADASRIGGDTNNDPFYGGIIPAFNDGRIMFYMGSIALVPLFRDMTQDCGILPIPKFNEEQEKYYTTMSVFNNGAIYIPITNENLERTGIIIEALSAESRYTLRPAYYDITLKTKLSRDNESSDMLDILFANRIADIGMTYNFGGLMNLFYGNNYNFASAYAKIENAANNEIQKLISKLEQ